MEQAPNKAEILWVNTVFLIATPILAAVLVPWYVLNHGVIWQEIAVALALWWMTGLGITVGYHRLFSHRGFKGSWPLRLSGAILGAAAWQNSAIAWCSDHRYHHMHVDTDADPYNVKRGFWYSHLGWILVKGERWGQHNNVPDLWKDPILRWQHKYYFPISIVFNVGVPVLLGLWTGRMGGALLIAGLLRVVVVHHFTFSINSFAHIIGTRPWSTRNTARDNWFLSLFTFGEGYHNFHHAFQYDYRNGPAWYNFDPGKWTIWTLNHIGVTSDLKRTPDDVLLRARFESQRLSFAERVFESDESSAWQVWLSEQSERLQARKDALAEALRSQRAALSERADTFQQNLQVQVLEAERSVEEKLDELEVQRQAWVRTKRRRWAAQTQEFRSEMADIKASLREAKRNAKAAIREWKQLSGEYAQAMS